jgi:hypothetical protein
MHLTSVNVDSTGACGRTLVTVCVKLRGPKEIMMINVVVPHKRDDQAAQEWNIVSQEQEISRASSLAFPDHENIVSKSIGVLQP